jgi:hypothetical protein
MIYREVRTEALRQGDRIRYLGRLYEVVAVKRSLGSGWEVSLEGGPTANFPATVFVADAEATERLMGERA